MRRKNPMLVRQYGKFNARATSNISSDSDYKTPPPFRNLEYLRRTGKAVYGKGVFWEEEELSDNDLDFGEELYLSDIVKEREKQTQADNESVSKKLSKCKIELRKRKEEKRIEEMKSKERALCIPPMPNFDLEKMQHSKTMPREPMFKFHFLEVPTFEDLIAHLKPKECDDSCAKPKQKKSRRKQSPGKRGVATKDLKSENVGKKTKDKDAARIKTQPNKLRSLPPVAVSQNEARALATSSEQDMVTLTTKVKGKTKSRQCEIHIHSYYEKMNGCQESRKGKVNSGGAALRNTNIPTIVLTSPFGKTSILSGVVAFNVLKRKIEHRKIMDKRTSLKEGVDAYMSNSFDTNKLNLKYSHERMKKFSTTKPDNHNESRDQTCSPVTILKDSRGEERTASTFAKIKPPFGNGRPNILPVQQNIEKPGEQMGLPCFTKVLTGECEEKLLQCLDDFLVRKEHVVSNINGKSCTTVTFTKKSVFDGKKL
jgi:hypothetical protein